MPSAHKLPSFLRESACAMDAKQTAHYAPYLRNWMVLHAHIRELEPSHASLNVLCCLMMCEYERKGGPRMDILVRLHGRFNKLRFDVERVELGTHA